MALREMLLDQIQKYLSDVSFHILIVRWILYMMYLSNINNIYNIYIMYRYCIHFSLIFCIKIVYIYLYRLFLFHHYFYNYHYCYHYNHLFYYDCLYRQIFCLYSIYLFIKATRHFPNTNSYILILANLLLIETKGIIKTKYNQNNLKITKFILFAKRDH